MEEKDGLVKQHLMNTSCDPGGTVVSNPPGNSRDAGSIPGLGRSPGDGNGNVLQYSCLGNHMDRRRYSSWGCKELDVTEHTPPSLLPAPTPSHTMSLALSSCHQTSQARKLLWRKRLSLLFDSKVMWSKICFFKDFFFFFCEPFLKSLLNLLQCCFCFMFWFFGLKPCRILVPWPGVEPALPAWEGKVLVTGPPGKSLQ